MNVAHWFKFNQLLPDFLLHAVIELKIYLDIFDFFDYTYPMKNPNNKTAPKFLSAFIISISVMTVFTSFKVQGELEESIRRGKEVYFDLCATCHKSNGKGARGKYPPLANSDFLMADKARSITIVMKGLSGPITVNDMSYDDVMLPQDLTEQESMDVLNYVRNSWGNEGEIVTLDEVKAELDN